MNGERPAAAFAGQLVEGAFGDFHRYPMHDQTIERIWSDPRHRRLLDTIVADPSISNRAKFLACEVLFRKDVLFMQRHRPEHVAEIYVDALRKDATGMANSWGLLYDHEDEGPVGIAFLVIGRKAIPSLCTLLDDERTDLTYQGSVEAAVGNRYGYRRKDFAAYYIGRILGTPLQYHRDPLDRDSQIDHLKRVCGLDRV